jgi:hypothetical protein
MSTPRTTRSERCKFGPKRAETRRTRRSRWSGCTFLLCLSESTVHHGADLSYLIEHILSQLGTVIQRDSSISVATDQHLYTALCEDESVWGVFKRMKREYTSRLG